ncbi:sulfatase-like hydrolase/transferase, partial [Candidatus Bipolaricaulota bacterium]|nr:sulfatase-like hydrolase/transferase [Candidatus Bipolaricaulota bacterium]
ILDTLRELNLHEDTLVLFTSDHGEPFGEHGYIRKARPKNYENLIKIPWIMKTPDGRWAGKEEDAIVQTVDLMPTLLDLIGIESDELTLEFTEPKQSGETENIFPQDLTSKATRQSLGGKSLVPLLDGEIDNIRDYAVGGHYNREWYLRTERWTYLFPLDEDKEPELYDRESDPGEQNNVIEDNPELAKNLELSLLRSVHSLRKQTD